MEKVEFIKLISGKMKLVRTETGFSQDKMSEILGISKKALVQIEKGRTIANWTTVIALFALFNQSELLLSIIRDQPVDFVKQIANTVEGKPKEKTMGVRFGGRQLKIEEISVYNKI